MKNLITLLVLVCFGFATNAYSIPIEKTKITKIECAKQIDSQAVVLENIVVFNPIAQVYERSGQISLEAEITSKFATKPVDYSVRHVVWQGSANTILKPTNNYTIFDAKVRKVFYQAMITKGKTLIV